MAQPDEFNPHITRRQFLGLGARPMPTAAKSVTQLYAMERDCSTIEVDDHGDHIRFTERGETSQGEWQIVGATNDQAVEIAMAILRAKAPHVLAI